MPANLGQDMQYAPSFFPYAGPVYIARHWRVLVLQNLAWRMYQLDMDAWPGSHKRNEHSRTIDGDLVWYPNIAGYINNTHGTKPQRILNVKWVTVVETPPSQFNGKQMDDHMMTVVIQHIAVDDEIFCDYFWSPI